MSGLGAREATLQVCFTDCPVSPPCLHQRVTRAGPHSQARVLQLERLLAAEKEISADLRGKLAKVQETESTKARALHAADRVSKQ
jgi:site-specific recombinase